MRKYTCNDRLDNDRRNDKLFMLVDFFIIVTATINNDINSYYYHVTTIVIHIAASIAASNIYASITL